MYMINAPNRMSLRVNVFYGCTFAMGVLCGHTRFIFGHTRFIFGVDGLVTVDITLANRKKVRKDNFRAKEFYIKVGVLLP